MLFNSYEFLFGFLPIVLIGYFILGRYGSVLALGWLALASLFFYAWWMPSALLLLLASILVNFRFGTVLVRVDDSRRAFRKRVLWLAVAVDLAVLGVFKYADFFVSSVDPLLQACGIPVLPMLNVTLPIGISFFTFTQIAFLVDCYEGKVRETNFRHYLLFVSYFPHLIAGPILHRAQMMPQFRRPDILKPQEQNLLVGLLLLGMGLAKKVLLADEFSQYATPVFEHAAQGAPLGLIAAWTGALAYSFQIYFDFSGYTDMALGMSRMMGIRMPLNFNSPYQSRSIIEFWRRWHMTLSHFLRDYLYIRLGGNRLGPGRRYANLLATMLLGGLWHGANWTFVVWGGLHGIYLIVNHTWRALGIVGRSPTDETRNSAGNTLAAVPAIVITFIAVTVAWVFFRAPDFPTAWTVLSAMINVKSAVAAHSFAAALSGIAVPTSLPYVVGLFSIGAIIVWGFPPSQVIAERMRAVPAPQRWRLAGALGFCICLMAVINGSRGTSEFIYFNF